MSTNPSRLIFVGILLALVGLGCPKNIPQAEIDAAEQAMVNIEDTKDCAPETYQAAKTMMDRAKALLKEERYEEAKTAFIAAKGLALKAQEECDKKRQEALMAQSQPQPASQEIEELDVNKSAPGQLVTVYFEFDQSTLTDEAREALNNNAEYLRAYERLRIQVEGHCDNRGSTEYNLALGERRAKAVKGYLVKMGITPERMDIISYGEERPVDSSMAAEALP